MRKQTLEIKDIFLIFLASVALLAAASILLRLVIKTYYEKSTEAYQNKLMKNQKIRSMKVHEQSGYNYKATPTIILKGQWLKEMGFKIGDYINVSCEEGKLIITLDAEKAAMEKAEAEFMEKEMKKLQKNFQAEKEQLHAQFVAERNTEYNGREVQ